MDFKVWGVDCNYYLSNEDKKYLSTLPAEVPTVEWVWEEMDRVWNACNLNNKVKLEGQDIGSFYSHPVWIMNGIFTEVDKVSIQHRKNIAHYFAENKIKTIADYGGGSGTLASEIANMCEYAIIKRVS